MTIRTRLRRGRQIVRLLGLRRRFNSPAFIADPYPVYTRLRDRDPVLRMQGEQWLLLGYDHGRAVLRDPTAGVASERVERERQAAFEKATGQPARERADTLLTLDPPDHTRIRRLMQGVFTPRAVEGLRPMIQGIVDARLDRADERGSMELITDLAFPVPFEVISSMLGMPPADADKLRDWSHTAVLGLEPDLDDDQMRRITQATTRLEEYLAGVIDWKRDNPADDLLTALIQAEQDGDKLTDAELNAQVGLLFIAGHETTVNLIGNGTLALLRNRRELERWQADPGLGPNAVDELLRYDPPVQASGRVLSEELVLGDSVIPAGHSVAVLIASANRDPLYWGPDADRLDIGRADASHHLSLGGGVHHCLGAALARLEAEIAIGTLITRFPELELAPEGPAWNGRIALRGLDRLPVRLRAA